MLLPLAAALATCAMTAGEEIRVENGHLLLAQVVAPGCGLTPAEQRLTVASLPAGVHETRLTRTALAALARRRLPALAIALDRGEAQVRLLRAETPSRSATPPC